MMSEKSKFDELDPAKIIQEMREEYWRDITSSEQAVDVDRFQALIARVGSEKYALAATSCKSIVKSGRVTRVPRSPAYLLGVVNLRGQILPVVDLGRLLGLSDRAETPRARLVVVESHGVRSAFKVDAVVGIEWIEQSRVREPQSTKSAIKAEYILGHIAPEGEDEWAVYLNLDKIIQGPELFLGKK